MHGGNVTVAIPVGPEPHHQEFLGECLESVRAQTLQANEVLIIDDMAGLDLGEATFKTLDMIEGGCWVGGIDHPLTGCRVWRAPWRLGVGCAFNAGVALARNDLVFMLGADDWLEPECLASCLEAFAARNDALGYYHVTVRYRNENAYEHPLPLPDPPIQDLPCNAALVTKQLWQHTGGFPIETGGGAPDAAFISILIGQGGRAGNLYHVKQGMPLYNVRLHAEQDTASRGPWQGVILETRDIVTREWRQPAWGRYS